MGTGERTRVSAAFKAGAAAAFAAGMTVVVLLGAAVFLASCAGLRGVFGGGVEKPRVTLVSARAERLSFEQADLLFEVRIENPNKTAMELEGFDYSLFVDEAKFLEGTQNREAAVEARGSANVRLPLAVRYEKLVEAVEKIGEEGSAKYRLDLGFRFDVPSLGEVPVSLSAEGEIPVLRAPSLKLEGVRVSRLDFTEADLVLSVAVGNPNGFSFSLDRFDFALDVGGEGWVSGGLEKKTGIAAGGRTVVPVPARVSTFFIGQTGYRQLRETRPLSYRLRGTAVFSAPIAPAGGIELPFDASGIVEVTR
jgi:LEA14-like dessication related protein